MDWKPKRSLEFKRLTQDINMGAAIMGGAGRGWKLAGRVGSLRG